MTIVTKTHSAQMVSNKGKQFKFDAIECMVRYLEDKEELEKQGHLLVADYENPGAMINAKSADYLICNDISSPMGANLSGFTSIESAKKATKDSTALYLNWEGVFKRLNH
jgi:copper chaperone NosL